MLLLCFLIELNRNHKKTFLLDSSRSIVIERWTSKNYVFFDGSRGGNDSEQNM